MNRMTKEEFKLFNSKAKKNKYNVAPKPDRTWRGLYRGRVQEIVFDSKKEMERFQYLLIMIKEGLIKELTLQEKFILHSGIKYYADFMYWDNDFKQWCIEDAKGVRTQVFKNKKKMFLELYPQIAFFEV